MSNDSYPYPVLGHGNDVASQWKVDSISFESLPDHIDVFFTIYNDDQDLEDAVEAGEAAVFARYHCSSTMSSGLLELTTPAIVAGQYRCVLDSTRVRGDVDISVFVAATQNTDTWRWSRQNPDYGTNSFALHRGDYLTDPTTFTVSADKDYDPLKPPLNSLIRPVRIPDLPDNTLKTQDAGDYIAVHCSNDVYAAMKRMRSANPYTLLSTVMLPVLVEAILDLDRYEESEREPWMESLHNLIESRHIEEDSAFVKAQKLLADPILRGLDLQLEED